MSGRQQRFNLQSALLALRNPEHLPPATARPAPLERANSKPLSVVFAYSPALGSSLQCCFGDLQPQLLTISAPSPKLLPRAEAELMLSQCRPRHPHFPNLSFHTIETLIPTSMGSYYVPDAGEIITRGKMKSCMMVFSVLRPCKTEVQRG